MSPSLPSPSDGRPMAVHIPLRHACTAWDELYQLHASRVARSSLKPIPPPSLTHRRVTVTKRELIVQRVEKMSAADDRGMDGELSSWAVCVVRLGFAPVRCIRLVVGHVAASSPRSTMQQCLDLHPRLVQRGFHSPHPVTPHKGSRHQVAARTVWKKVYTAALAGLQRQIQCR